MQPRQANTILTITRHFLTTASNLPQQHDKTLSFLVVKCSSTSCRISGVRFSRQTLNRSSKALRTASSFSEHQNVHSRCPPPLRARNCLGARILEFSSAQNTKKCTRADPPPFSEHFQVPKRLKHVLALPPPPPSQSPKLPGSTHFGTFKRPKH